VTAWRAVAAAGPRPSRRGATWAAARSRSSSTHRSWHKSDAGEVLLELSDGAAIELAVDALLAAAARTGIEPRGLLVEPMAAPGIELIVGGRRDAVFGPAVLVGFGGVLAEVLDDVAVLLAPVGRAEVVDRLRALRGSALLRGVRGSEPVDVDAVAAIVVAVGDLLVADPGIEEIDLNPVIAGPAGALAVDALVVLGSRPA
jgi:hypothetical protein